MFELNDFRYSWNVRPSRIWIMSTPASLSLGLFPYNSRAFDFWSHCFVTFKLYELCFHIYVVVVVIHISESCPWDRLCMARIYITHKCSRSPKNVVAVPPLMVFRKAERDYERKRRLGSRCNFYLIMNDLVLRNQWPVRV